MKKLLLALAALSLPLAATPAQAEHRHHNSYHHEYRHHNDSNVRFGISIGGYPTYYYPYAYDYRPRYGFYSNRFWREGSTYRCIRADGYYGYLRDRHGRIVWAFNIDYAPRPFYCR